MNVNNCPCCSESMLLHLSSRRSYWFCRHCRVEMPNSEARIGQRERKTGFDSSSLEAAIAPLKSRQSVAMA